MKNQILHVFFILVSIHANIFAQVNRDKKELLLKDLDSYRAGIWLNHVNPFTNISRNEFSNEIELIKKSSASMNEDELLVALLKVNAKIQDEHTAISIPAPKYFPLSVYWFEEGLYILTADTEYSDVSLSKIIAINNFPVTGITTKLSEIIPGTNAWIKKSVPEYLCIPSVLHGFKIIDSIDYAMFTLVSLSGDTVRKKIESKIHDKIKYAKTEAGERLLRNQSRDNYWYKYDSITNSLYFHYMRCAIDKQKPFKKFEKELLNELETRQAKRLIIDLRYNSGGSSQLLSSFIDKLWKTNVRKHRELFVITGRRTFSSAVLNAFDLKIKNDATLLGEETGGSINHFGEVNYFELPNSKIRVSYSTKYFLNVKGLQGSLKPDFSFPMKFADFLNGIDQPLNYAETH